MFMFLIKVCFILCHMYDQLWQQTPGSPETPERKGKTCEPKFPFGVWPLSQDSLLTQEEGKLILILLIAREVSSSQKMELSVNFSTKNLKSMHKYFHKLFTDPGMHGFQNVSTST